MIHYKKEKLALGDDSEELLSEQSGEFPFVCNLNESDVFIGHHIPWHWHEWIELNYVEKGHFRIETPEQSLEAGQGEAVFINVNVMHAYDFAEQTEYYSYTCDTRFLAGEHGSYLDQKYFSPILRSRALPIVHIKPDTARRVRMIGYLVEITEALKEEPRGFEFMIREAMSRFFMLFLEEVEGILVRERAGNERDEERIKQMLRFIYGHYMEQIGLTEIAGAAGVSPRECTRCFGRAIGRPPVRFLVEYRTQMAAALLLRTGDSISVIAEKCGFLSDSYFGKIFKEIYGCTPREYRKSGQA